jgi:hypothetical protein
MSWNKYRCGNRLRKWQARDKLSGRPEKVQVRAGHSRASWRCSVIQQEHIQK